MQGLDCLVGKEIATLSFFWWAHVLFTVLCCPAVSVECLMKGYSFSIHSAYLLCCTWKQWGNGISSAWTSSLHCKHYSF